MATTWRPDTCQCVIELNATDEAKSIALHQCKRHESLDNFAAAQAVLTENRMKNEALNSLVEQFSDDTISVTVSDTGGELYVKSMSDKVNDLTLRDACKNVIFRGKRLETVVAVKGYSEKVNEDTKVNGGV